MKQDRSTRDGSKHTTFGRPFLITSELTSSVKLIPDTQAGVEPCPANSGILTDDYCNATAITNWTDEIKRRIAKFEPMTKRLGTNCAGRNHNRQCGTR